MKKTLKVKMLPTEKATEGGIYKMSGGTLKIADRLILGNKIFDVGVSSSVYEGSCQPQHLYLICIEERTKGGDWWINLHKPNTIGQYGVNQANIPQSPWIGKVIFTTDPELIKKGIPEIPFDFIKLYAEKNGEIDEVEVKEEDTLVPDNMIEGSEKVVRYLTVDYAGEVSWSLPEAKTKKDDVILEDYKRRLKTANDMINNLQVTDDANPDYIRLKTKASCYKEFIFEIEREFKNINQEV